MKILDEISSKISNERQVLNNSDLKQPINSHVTIDIRKEFNTEKDYKNYMESKFSSIFGDDEEESSEEDDS